MFDDFPSLKWCKYSFGDKIGKSSSRKQLNKISLISALSKIISIPKAFNKFFLLFLNNRNHVIIWNNFIQICISYHYHLIFDIYFVKGSRCDLCVLNSFIVFSLPYSSVWIEVSHWELIFDLSVFSSPMYILCASFIDSTAFYLPILSFGILLENFNLLFDSIYVHNCLACFLHC